MAEDPGVYKPKKSQLKRTRKSTGDKVRASQPRALAGAGPSVRTSGPRGKGVSLGIDVKVNYKSWAKTMASIEMLELKIHRMDQRGGRYKKEGRLKHFHGVKTMMRKMFGRAETCVPPLVVMIKPMVQAMFVENFATNGLPSGGWAPLSPSYGAWKALKHPGAPTMVATGKLFESLTVGLREDKITNNSVEFGNKVRYATFHQYGTTRMPMRRLVFEHDPFAKSVAGLVGEYVHGVRGIAPGSR